MRIRQISLTKTGRAGVLQVSEVEKSDTLGADDVRVRVHYSGINFVDLHIRLGLHKGGPKRPFVPGFEISGVIEAVGSNVTKVKVGDPMLAGTNYGGYSSHVVIPAWQVVPLPVHLTLKEGAAFPVAFMSAYVALMELGRIRPGDRVMIDCATGGVGTMAMQIAKDVEADVIGLTRSPDKLDYIDQYGARGVLRESYIHDACIRDFDIILNSAGGKTITRDLKRLRPTGRIVCMGASSLIKNGRPDIKGIADVLLHMRSVPFWPLYNENKGVFGFSLRRIFEDKELIQTFLPAIQTATAKPQVDRVFAAENISDAHRHLENGAACGKVLLKWIDNA